MIFEVEYCAFYKRKWRWIPILPLSVLSLVTFVGFYGLFYGNLIVFVVGPFGLFLICLRFYCQLTDSKPYIQKLVINDDKFIIHYYYKDEKQDVLTYDFNQIKIEYSYAGPGNYRGPSFIILANGKEVIRQYPYGDWNGDNLEDVVDWLKKAQGGPKYVKY